ncbi:hypothetical protein [Profundibacterium mesophilum]|uniref:Uncharacterized protein n=1 Tax=Profundibacterium mesophilum KAUST100406-0324 TaxID=1037889 RepID=A0A921TFR6_9RHOB|nr:hypothetical protein [Profundibacterium mesophilum]KAF0676694.1 hypothetical protein PMES_00985 [Profundibacterium mesophilum KAUST100406-0324]
MMLRIALTLTLALTATQVSASAAELIDFLEGELSDIREEVEARDAAPNEGGYFESDKADHQADIDAVLDKALRLVVPETFDLWAEQIREIDAATTDAETERADLLLQQMRAKTSEGVGMVGKILGREHERGSREDINRKLAEIDAALVQLGEDRDLAATEFAKDMRELHGVKLTDAQAKAILYSVNGGLMVESTVVLQALGDVERRLAEVMDAGIGPDARRTYLGVSSATRLIHARLLQRHLAAYDGDWLPRLEEMRAETEALQARTRQQSQAVSREDVRQTYENNMAIQERILGVIDRYEAMLERRRGLTAEALDLARERADAAVNTLITLETAASLSLVISEATSQYEDVMSVDLPELEQLDPQEFEEMFDISRRLGS